MSSEQKWPDTIWVVRHGESAANVARAAADASGDPHIGLAMRDVDVALSDRGWLRDPPAPSATSHWALALQQQ